MRVLTDRPFVTLSCPTYGRPRFVRRAVEIFLAQTWTRSELLIFDDSPAELQTDVRETGRVRVFRLKERLTVGEKHNLAHKHGRGDVFGYMDDDDFFGPRRIVRQLEPLVLGRGTISGIYRDYVLTIGEPPEWSRFRVPVGMPAAEWVGNAKSLGFKLPIHDGTAFYCRSVLRHGFEHPTHAIGQKVLFLNALAAAGEACVQVPNDGLFVYVRHKRNTWNFRRQKVLVPTVQPGFFPPAWVDFYRDGRVS